jgi:hypothetical protein
MMICETDILEFIQGECETMNDPRKFVHNWIQTERYPCSVCGIDKSKCEFHKKLVKKGNIVAEEDRNDISN